MPRRPIRDNMDREPLLRKVENVIDTRASNARNSTSDRLAKRMPEFDQRNIGDGFAVGVVQAAIGKVLKDTLGVPFGSDAEITDVNATVEGTVYTLNVEAPTKTVAEVRSFFEAGAGFTSILTDLLNVEETRIMKQRVMRDTYQVEILVVD